jgi:hypothetical protein
MVVKTKMIAIAIAATESLFLSGHNPVSIVFRCALSSGLIGDIARVKVHVHQH